MKILSIDQSLTKTAYIIFDFNTLEIIDFDVIKTTNTITDELRIKHIGDVISDVILSNSIEIVYIEGIKFDVKNSNNNRKLGGLYYYLLICFYNLHIEYLDLAPNSIKKHAGKGNYSKTQMIEAIPKSDLTILKSKNHKKTTGLEDLADAYHIGRLGIITTRGQ